MNKELSNTATDPQKAAFTVNRSQERAPLNFSGMFDKARRSINYVPIDTRERTSRWGDHRSSYMVQRDFSLEEIEDIIRSGDLSAIRELSRYFYRTNARYRNNIDFLASLFLYDTLVTPIYETGKGSKTQIIKAFYNACSFVEALDVKNTLVRVTREWLKTGVYYGILQEKGSKVVLQDLPLEYCRTRVKDFNNLNVLEFNIQYFINTYTDAEMREAVVLNYPEVIQRAWRQWKNKTLKSPWVKVPSSAGGITFCFSEDRTPLLIAAIPDLAKLKDAVGREEKRDENELYKLLIQRMPIDNDGNLVFQLDEVAQIHAGVANMLQDLDTVDVLTTFGDTTLESLQDSSAASQANNRLEKYANNVWDALGTSALLFNAENSSSLAYAIKRIEGIMRTYLNAYDTWIRYLINSRFSRTGLTFDFEILPTTAFNIKDYQGQYLQGAQFGYSKMRAGVAMGVKQRNLISTIDFENEFLDLTEKMIPLQNSYTETGDENSDQKNKSSKKNSSTSTQVKDITNKGGRPTLADEDKSEKTQANIDSMG